MAQNKHSHKKMEEYENRKKQSHQSKNEIHLEKRKTKRSKCDIGTFSKNPSQPYIRGHLQGCRPLNTLSGISGFLELH